MLRLISPLFYVCLTLCGGAFLPTVAQDKPISPSKPATPEKTTSDAKTPPPEKAQNTAGKTPTAEQIAGGVIFAYGSRGVLIKSVITASSEAASPEPRRKDALRSATSGGSSAELDATKTRYASIKRCQTWSIR